MTESFPRQVDKKSGGPQGERGLEFSRRKKGQTFFPPLHSLGLRNNNVSCLRTVSGLNLLANPVILKCKLWEEVWWGLYNLQTFFGFTGEYITPLLTLTRGTLSAPFWCLCQKLSLSPLYFNKTLLHKSSEWSSLISGPRLNSSPPEAKNSGIFAWFSNNLSKAYINILYI